MSARARDAGRIIRLAVLSVAALVMISPYLWMLSVASKPRDEIFSAPLPRDRQRTAANRARIGLSQNSA